MDIRSEIPLELPGAGENEDVEYNAAASTTPYSAAGAGTAHTPLPFGHVEILRGEVPPATNLTHNLGRICYDSGPGWAQVEVPWAGRYRIELPSRIIVETAAGAGDRVVGLYVTGFVLAYLLSRHGVLMVHGSACAEGNGAFMLCGARGAGKSTTAAALAGRGYPVLCDDVVPVAARQLVLPGIPYPKLLPDAYRRLVGDPAEAAELFDGVDKYRVSVAATRHPLPLSAVYILELAGEAAPSLTALTGTAKIMRMLPLALSPDGERGEAARFRSIVSLFGRIPVYRLCRLEGLDTLDEVVDLIDTHRKESRHYKVS